MNRAFVPFWNNIISNISRRIWIPPETRTGPMKLFKKRKRKRRRQDFVQKYKEQPYGTIIRNKNQENIHNQTWLNPDIPEIAEKNKVLEKKELDKEKYFKKHGKNKKILRNHKIKIYPTESQKKVIHKWFGTSRFVYNRCVEYSKKPTSAIFTNTIWNPDHYSDFSIMREIFVTKNGSIYDEYIPRLIKNDWEFEVPKDIRAESVREFTTQLATNKKKVALGHQKFFEMKFKSRKNPQSIDIPKTAVQFKKNTNQIWELRIFSTYLKSPIKLGKRFCKKCKYGIGADSDCTLRYDRCGNYYLMVPKNTEKKEKVKTNSQIGLDPGIRTFQTGFSQKEVVEFKVNEKILKIKDKIKRLQQLRDHSVRVLENGEFKIRIKSRLNLKIRKRFLKIKNYVKEMHWKSISHLLKNYDDVLVGKFESQKLAQLDNLNEDSKWMMLMCSHYQFKVRLDEKSEEYKNFRMYEINEDYTTKTCTRCGTLNDIGSSKKYRCGSCGFHHDRDVNASRNILLKHVKIEE